MSENRFCFILCTLFLVLTISFVSAARLPIVDGDNDNWGAILNEYLTQLAGINATTLNITGNAEITGDLHMGGAITHDSPVEIREGLSLTNASNSPTFTIYNAHGDHGDNHYAGNVSDAFANALIFQSDEIDNVNNMEVCFWDKENQVMYFCISEGGSQKATTVRRSFQIIGNVSVKENDENFTLCEGANYVDCQTDVTGADLLVQDDIEAQSIYANENFQATGNLSLGQKIVFAFGQIIDNIVDGWITITGGLNVTNNLEVNGSAVFYGGNFSVNNSDLFVDVSTGRVGIGTTSPTSKLEVVGDIVSKGTSWTSRTPAANEDWGSITYGNGLFVAVSDDEPNDLVMTSPDGITWTVRTSIAADEGWTSVTYGNGLFVAVSDLSFPDRVMTSSNGLNWTGRIAAANNYWSSVTYGNGLFVAVSFTCTGDCVMTSPDGIAWTSRAGTTDEDWHSVTYGNGLFVAVSASLSDARVMTSSDGITWTDGTAATDEGWSSVTYGNGLFAAVSTGGGVMTSTDGINWISRTSASDNSWRSVTYGNGLFAAVSFTGTGDRVMTSPDGITWTSRTPAAEKSWRSVTYGNGLFAAVSHSGVMTSGKAEINVVPTNNIQQGGFEVRGNLIVDNTTLFVNSTNNRVGINTTSPTHTLNIVGDLNVTGTSYLGDVIINADNVTVNYILNKSNSNITLDSDVVITGTLYGGSPLQIGSDINATTGIIYFTNGYKIDSSTGNPFVIKNSNAAGKFGVINTNSGADAEAVYVLQSDAGFYGVDLHSLAHTLDPGKVVHWSNDSITGEIWRLNSTVNGSFDFQKGFDDSILFMNGSTGFVGIGTTSPAGKLTVYTTAWNAGNDVPMVNFTNLDVNANDADVLLVRGGANNAGSTVFKVQDYSGNTDFVILGDGNVGIGTTSPQNKLNVVGDLNVTGTSYLGDLIIEADNITVNNIISKDGNISFYNNAGSEKVRITNVGNVGIGTDSPVQALDINEGHINLDRGYGLIWGNRVSDILHQTDAYVIVVNSSNGISLDFDANGNNGGFFGIDDFGVRAFTILEGGNVGIGTDSPNAPLEVEGVYPGVVGGFSSGLLHVTTSDNSEFSNSVITGHNSFGGNTQLWYLGSTTSTNNDIAFINRQDANLKFSTNNTERMRIDNTGNVGINTTTPSHTLNVVGDLNVTGTSYLGNLILEADNITINNIISKDGNITFYNSSGSEKMRITQDGKVGIGVTVPLSELTITRGSPIKTQGDIEDIMSIIGRATDDNDDFRAARYIAERAATSDSSTKTHALNAFAYDYGSVNLTNSMALIGQRAQASKRASGGTITTARAFSGAVNFLDQSNPHITGTILDARIFAAEPIDAEDGNISNAYSFYGEAHRVSSEGTLFNATGMWLEKQTKGSTNNYGIVLDGDGAGADIVFGAEQDANIFWDGSALVLNGSNVSVPGDLNVTGSTTISGNFSVNNSDLFIDVNSGRVGIGTTSPDALLNVRGQAIIGDDDNNNGYGGGNLVVSGPKAGTTMGQQDVFSIVRRKYGGTWGQIATFTLGRWQTNENNPETRLDINLKDVANGVDIAEVTVMTLQSDGNIGIGTTSPGFKLEVNGSIGPTQNNTYNLGATDTFWANIYVGSVVNPSERELKKNIEEIAVNEQESEEILDKLTNTTIYSYNYNWENESEKEHIGVMADEAPEEIVAVNDNEEPIGINLGNYIGFVHVGLKELAQEVDALKLGTTAVNGLIKFKNAIFTGHVSFSEDSVGTAKVLVNETFVRVEFSEEYEFAPIVTLTVVGLPNFFYGVDEITTKGFKILISDVQEKEVVFNWHAFGQGEGVVNSSNETITNITISENITDINETIKIPELINDTSPENITEVINITDTEINITIPENVTEDNETPEENITEEVPEEEISNETTRKEGNETPIGIMQLILELITGK